MRRVAIWLVLAASTPALAGPNDDKQGASQKDADRHFKSGVALYKEGKFSEALAEFERAYEIAPHPTVLFNIATCYRELSQYGKAVQYYERFLADGKGKVPAARLKEAQTDLDAINGRIARIKVKVAGGEGVTLTLDGKDVDPAEMPLLVPPGEHKLVARASGKRDAEKSVRVASGDDVEVSLTLVDELGSTGIDTRHSPNFDGAHDMPSVPVAPAARKRFALGAAFGTNLLMIADTGAPTIGGSFVVHPRVELGLDAVVVAFAVMPSVRVRLAGDALAVHATVAAPIAFTDEEMSETFVAGAAGLGLRYRAAPGFAIRLETLVSFATKDHGTTVPAFIGGELWF
jgi:hypothetical protein